LRHRVQQRIDSHQCLIVENLLLRLAGCKKGSAKRLLLSAMI
jgi:hypothetical protein